MNHTKLTASFIPAHPTNGGHSMRRYWEALVDSQRADDPFHIQSVIEPTSRPPLQGTLGRLEKLYLRKFSYPGLIRRNFRGEIAHVLDHSWSDMIRFVPPGTLRVVTVHDLIPLRFPGELSVAQTNRFRGWVNHAKTADAIVADSEYTKREIIHFLQIPSEKIHVVACGVDIPAQDLHSKRPCLRGEMGRFKIGSIGSTLTRKNLGIFPAALSELKKLTGQKVILVRAGQLLPDSLAHEIRTILGAEGLVELGRLPDSEIPNFYSDVDTVVMPSLYEGFGLPLLEAMAARAPVISSNATSLPEVGGDDVLYFDPNEPLELAQRLADVANHGVPQSRLDQAFARAEKFSWRASLEGIFAVYDKALARRIG